jgi:hypothetical protein
MCFSAQAAFTAGALLSAAGLFSVAQVLLNTPKSMNRQQCTALTVFAAVPLVFGVHQVSEGFVWLDTTNLLAIRIFAYTAWTFWPLYISLSIAFLEYTRPSSLPVESIAFCAWPRKLVSPATRKKHLCINIGLAVLCYLIFTLCLYAVEPLSVNTDHGRMEYKTCQKYVEEVPEWQNKTGRFVYTYAVVASLFLSSLNYSMILAAVTGLSAAISYYLWEAQFESTWCYFAALISSFIVFMVRCELQAYPVGKPVKKN